MICEWTRWILISPLNPCRSTDWQVALERFLGDVRLSVPSVLGSHENLDMASAEHVEETAADGLKGREKLRIASLLEEVGGLKSTVRSLHRSYSCMTADGSSSSPTLILNSEKQGRKSNTCIALWRSSEVVCSLWKSRRRLSSLLRTNSPKTGGER